MENQIRGNINYACLGKQIGANYLVTINKLEWLFQNVIKHVIICIVLYDYTKLKQLPDILMLTVMLTIITLLEYYKE